MTKATKEPQRKDPRWVAFGRRLVDLRKANRWLAMDVARLIEVDPATYSHIENGNRATGPERATIEKLARLYQISVDDLLGTQEIQHHARPTPPGAADTPSDRKRDDPGRDVFPRAGSPSDPQSIAIYEAVSDALYAVLQDALAALGEARGARRTAQNTTGEARRTGTDTPRGDRRR